MAYRALIFDFNGVLWWDSHLQEQSWKDFSTGLRGSALSDDEIAVHVHGRNNRHTLEYLSGRKLTESEVISLAEEKEEAYRRLCLAQGERFRLSPGATDLLDDMLIRRLPHTIATASGLNNMRFFFDQLNLDHWFSIEDIVYDDGSHPGKPAPDIYLQAAANLQQAPGACVVVEDSLSGLQAARSAGIGCVIALGPPVEHQRLRQVPGVTRVVEQLGQVLDLNLF